MPVLDAVALEATRLTPAALAVEFDEIVIVLANVTLVAAAGPVGTEIAIVPPAALIEVTMAPVAIFVPLTAMPTRTFAMSLAVKPEINVLLAVLVRLLEVNVGVIELSVAFAAMPEPRIGWPTSKPVVVETFVIRLLPNVVSPLKPTPYTWSSFACRFATKLAGVAS